MIRLALLLGLVSLIGCGINVAFIPMNRPPRALQARDPGTVEVFAAARPSRPFVDVGLIEVQQESYLSGHDEAALLQRMRVEAAGRGCDGLMILGPNDATVVSGTSGHTSSATVRGYRGSCIVYTSGMGEAPLAEPARPASPRE